MSHVRASLKRKLSRLHKRQERVSTEKLVRHTSPFFEYDASFRIFGAGKFHDEMNAVTGLVPTKLGLAGEPRFPRSTLLHKQDVWTLSSPLGYHVPLDDHVDWLLETLTPHADFLTGVIAQAGSADLCLGCLSEVPYPMIATGKSTTELIKRFDLELMFNFTCV
ncbi:DUF4279 domain-containing protein [Massilia pseudoviolaceinigra]|uniref:DUF4279 domain-containing protein n=1 Tax=Massilia pseudoviolaceinigra TaxID=3057165 RepID=UPI0027965401|nr:DUF4279 domain-containing protein [Massilia sp. CCM 9206]MDQ1924072.1 DUF4279 domain-containing protein [Massilia sp. CCM 9206]